MATKNNPIVKWVRRIGNREPLAAILMDNSGTPINLTGRTITFDMVDSSDAAVVTGGSVTVVSAADGSVAYYPAAADVDTAGTYSIYFKDANSPSHDWPWDGARWHLVIQTAGPQD